MRNGGTMKAAFAALALMTGVAAADEIKVGFNGDLSASPSALSGQAGVLGIQAAIEDINAAGGLLGKKVVLVTRDDLSQPPKSIQNMSDLIDNEKVSVVFGPTNSGNALAWKNIPNTKRVPSIGLIGGATDITRPPAGGQDNYMFRVSMVDRSQVSGLMAYAAKNPKSKLIGYMSETTGFGQGGLKDIEEIGKLHGIKPAAVERFGVADTDMTSQLNKMKAAGVDTIVVWAQGTPTGQLLRSMEKINYFPLVLSSWAADNKSFYDAAGEKLAEFPIFMRTLTDDRTPKQQKLLDRVSAKLGSASAFPFVAHGYDSMMLYAEAVKQADTVDGKPVHDALESLKTPYDGYMKLYKVPFSTTQHEGLVTADLKWAHWKGGNLATYSDDITKGLSDPDFKM